MKSHINNLTTLCYLRQGDSYLMLHRIKKEQDVNKDKWIGVGGHFEAGESPEECLLREVWEETGLTLTRWKFCGFITFTFRTPDRECPAKSGCSQNTSGIPVQEDMEYMCLYTADGYEGTLTDCEEGSLEWIKKSDLQGLPLWEGDRIFLRLLEEEAPFFSLKLDYLGERLEGAVLDGRELELLDIRKEDGSLTGFTRERFLAHADGTLHGTSHVWIVRPGTGGRWEVLLQQRSEDKDSFPGCYDTSSAGHIPAGSDFMESAIRELREELGIQADENDLQYIGMHRTQTETQFHHRPWKNNEISAVYVYRQQVETEKLILQEEEVCSVKWMDLEECLEAVRREEPEYCICPDELELLLDYLRRGWHER